MNLQERPFIPILADGEGSRGAENEFSITTYKRAGNSHFKMSWRTYRERRGESRPEKISKLNFGISTRV